MNSSSGQLSPRSHRLANDAAWVAAAAAAAGPLTRLRRGARTDSVLQRRRLLASHRLSSQEDDTRAGFDADGGFQKSLSDNVAASRSADLKRRALSVQVLIGQTVPVISHLLLSKSMLLLFPTVLVAGARRRMTTRDRNMVNMFHVTLQFPVCQSARLLPRPHCSAGLTPPDRSASALAAERCD